MIVALHGAEFFAYHGFYPEEQHTGNCFIVDIEVEFEPDGSNGLSSDNLKDTVNYEELYHICGRRMQQPQKLIETVATFIMEDIKAQYSFAEKITVSIKKLNPLAGAKVKYTQITINYTR
ncbi:dihydroneopterin aldolase [Mucilaginibacter calamicampi]|uniref:7,8-dihydroneopterin aldolase n=1 Tax=Mucilaginibacter calamicampi TaxID=1302352 RepID=A0ABW2YYZ0_9SPHI